jgi:hypothetical protein
MSKIPSYILATFGEFIVQHNKMDFKCKMFLASFVENDMIGHLLTSNQNFEFIRKRINSIYEHLIENDKLANRWEKLQKDMTLLNEVRNDIAHSIIDLEPSRKKIFVLSRFTEKSVLKFSTKDKLYKYSELKKLVSKQKNINRKLGYLFHTTYKEYNDIVFYSGEGMMF